MLFIIYQLEDYWSMMKLSCRPLTLNSYKAFKKQKQVWENSLLYFLQNFWKKKKNLLYSIIWPLTSNFHHIVQTILILLPAKFHFNPHWGKFYNMLFFSFKKGLNGQMWLNTFLRTEKKTASNMQQKLMEINLTCLNRDM